MKNFKLWPLLSLILIAFTVSAQRYTTEDDLKKIQLAYFKTTSLVFPFPIKSADKGSQEVLLQKAKGVENILLLKAAKEYFTQTNLTVVTSDGKLYGFVLNYDELCPDLNLVVDNSIVLNQDIQFFEENENQKKIQQYASLALYKKTKGIGLKNSRFEIKIQTTGIFIHQDVMYFRVLLGNGSKINFDIDQLRFFIGDQKKSKRTASQENEIRPIFSTTDLLGIPSESEVTLVFALPKFTIAEKKHFILQLIEKNQGRQIELIIKNDDLHHLEILNSL